MHHMEVKKEFLMSKLWCLFKVPEEMYPERLVQVCIRVEDEQDVSLMNIARLERP